MWAALERCFTLRDRSTCRFLVSLDSARRFACSDRLQERHILPMNLYRNFGNLLENWVTEGYSNLHFESGEGLDTSDSFSRRSVPLFTLKSESEDSGVETVSTSPCHSHQCSGLTDESQPGFVSGRDGTSPASPTPSSHSSSSSCVSLGSVAPVASYQKVEQALRRTEKSSCREPSQQIEQGINGLRHQSKTASFQTNGSRAHWFARPRRTHSQPPDPQKAELYRNCNKRHRYFKTLQAECKDGDQVLSPGLLYLEQVCRMLENIAWLQEQNHGLQNELETLRSQQAETQCLSLLEEDLSYAACKRLQILEHGDLNEHPVFRHRSLSDTQAASCRQRRTWFDLDEQIADVLVEEPENTLPEEHKKLNKIKKLKFTSFRRQDTKALDKEKKSFQPKKKSKLPSFFRRRMTTRL